MKTKKQCVQHHASVSPHDVAWGILELFAAEFSFRSNNINLSQTAQIILAQISKSMAYSLE